MKRGLLYIVMIVLMCSVAFAFNVTNVVINPSTITTSTGFANCSYTLNTDASEIDNSYFTLFVDGIFNTSGTTEATVFDDTETGATFSNWLSSANIIDENIGTAGACALTDTCTATIDYAYVDAWNYTNEIIWTTNISGRGTAGTNNYSLEYFVYNFTSSTYTSLLSLNENSSSYVEYIKNFTLPVSDVVSPTKNLTVRIVGSGTANNHQINLFEESIYYEDDPTRLTSFTASDSYICQITPNNGTSNGTLINSSAVVVTTPLPILNVSPNEWSATQDSDDVFSFVFNVSNTGGDASSCEINSTNSVINGLISYDAFNVSGSSYKEVNTTLANIPAGSYSTNLYFNCNGVNATTKPTLILGISTVVVEVAGGGGGGAQILGYDANYSITPNTTSKTLYPGNNNIYEFKVENLGDINLDMNFIRTEGEFSELFSFIVGDEEFYQFTLPAINQFESSTEYIRYRINIPDDFEDYGKHNITIISTVEGIEQDQTFTFELEIKEGGLFSGLIDVLNYPLITYKVYAFLDENSTTPYITNTTENTEIVKTCLSEKSCQEAGFNFRVKHVFYIGLPIGIGIYSYRRIKKRKK